MTIGRPRFDPRQRVFSGPRTNERIRVPEVRVIGPDGDMMGLMETRSAQQFARERELDLVEVNPKAHPPVCKVMDYGKFKYEEKKKANEARKRQTTVELKEIKLRPKTDDHDIDFKVKHARRFLAEGDKVKLTCRFRGREITHPETAQRQLELIAHEVDDMAQIETACRMEGRTMTMILSPRVTKAQMQVTKRKAEEAAERAAEKAAKAAEKAAEPGEAAAAPAEKAAEPAPAEETAEEAKP